MWEKWFVFILSITSINYQMDWDFNEKLKREFLLIKIHLKERGKRRHKTYL